MKNSSAEYYKMNKSMFVCTDQQMSRRHRYDFSRFLFLWKYKM